MAWKAAAELHLTFRPIARRLRGHGSQPYLTGNWKLADAKQRFLKSKTSVSEREFKKIKRKARKEGGSWYTLALRQVCLPIAVFGITSAIGSLKLWDLSVSTIWCGREARVGGSWRGFSEPSKRTKLQRTVISAAGPLPGSSPAVPWVLALRSCPLPAPWSPAPPDHSCPLLLSLTDPPLGLYPGPCLSGPLWLWGQGQWAKRSWLPYLGYVTSNSQHNAERWGLLAFF